MATATLTRPPAPAGTRARSRRRLWQGRALPYGWPIYAIFIPWPLYWATGTEALVWPLLSIPMLMHVARRRRIRAPKGFGIYLAFLAWMVISAVSLHDFSRIMAFAYRGHLYFTAAVLLIYVFNLDPKRLPTRRIVFTLMIFWAVIVAFGFGAMLFSSVSFRSPMELLLPQRLVNIPFVYALVHPSFAGDSRLLGYTVARTRAPFNYTNEWGSNVALLTPFAVYGLYFLRSRWLKALTMFGLVASLVPIILSINRGLWISLSLGVVFVAGRIIARGNIKVFAGALAAIAVLTIITVFTPLGQVITDRIAHPNTAGRAALYSSATDKALASPLLGYGAPQPDASRPGAPSAGTHGQLWTLLVSQGVPGLVLYVAFFAFAFLAAWRVSLWGLWPQAVLLIGLVQMPVYNGLPVQIHLMMIAIGLCWRDLQGRRGAGRAAAAPPASATAAPRPPVAGPRALGAS